MRCDRWRRAGPDRGPYVPTSPSELLARTRRRSAEMRRTRRFGATGSLVIVLAAALVVALLPGGSRLSPPSRRSDGASALEGLAGAKELTADARRAASAPARVEAAVQQAEVGFSLRLLARLSLGQGADNVLIAPFSLATALAMLELGSAGTTELAIARTLGTAGLSPAEQAAGWGTLDRRVLDDTGGSTARGSRMPRLDLADGLWIQSGFPVAPPFVDALASYFGSGVWTVDFAHDARRAAAALNRWASRHTDGRVHQLFGPGELDDLTRLVLANAVDLSALWENPFSRHEGLAPFHLPSGRFISADFMSRGSANGVVEARASIGSRYSAVELPYAGGRLSALVVEPSDGAALGRFVAALTPPSLGRIVAGLHEMRLSSLALPSFDLQSRLRLDAPLSAMGMGVAFQAADFSGITTHVPLQLQAVQQDADLRVLPDGTVGAAATGVSVGLSALPMLPSLTFDHPFLFLVRDNATGAVLFEAVVQDPSVR
jgi:serpin B